MSRISTTESPCALHTVTTDLATGRFQGFESSYTMCFFKDHVLRPIKKLQDSERWEKDASDQDTSRVVLGTQQTKL